MEDEQVKEILVQMFGNEAAATEFIDSFTKKLEEAEQQRYSLQRQLQHKEVMEKTYLEEIDALKAELDVQRHNLDIAQHEADSISAANKKQAWSTQQQLDSVRLQQQHEAEEVKRLQQQVTDLQQQLSAQQSQLNETCSEEMVPELFSQLTTLQDEKCTLAEELASSQQKVQQAELQQQLLQQQVEHLTEQSEQVQQENSVYRESLKNAREEVQDLTCQVQALKAENHADRGNSLFGELDDRRVKAEKAAISLKVKYEALVKQHALTCKHLQHLKCEIRNIMARGGGGTNADRDYMEQLQKHLSQALSTEQELSRRLAHSKREVSDMEHMMLKTLENALAGLQGRSECASGQIPLAQLLHSQMQQKQQRIDQLEKELESTHLSLMAETDKTLEANRHIYKLQSAQEKAAGTASALQLQLRALQIKYEPDMIKEQKLVKFRVLKENVTENDNSVVEKTDSPRKDTTHVQDQPLVEEKPKNLDAAVDNVPKNKFMQMPPEATTAGESGDCKVQ